MLNRANRRSRIFRKELDYQAFEVVLQAAAERFATMRILGWCPMPNHRHLVLWPGKDGELAALMRWLTITHTQRHHAVIIPPGRGIATRVKERAENPGRRFVPARRDYAVPRRAGISTHSAQSKRWRPRSRSMRSRRGPGAPGRRRPGVLWHEFASANEYRRLAALWHIENYRREDFAR